MPTLRPNDIATNALLPGVQLRVDGQAIVELGSGQSVAVSGTRVFGPYQRPMRYRISALAETVYDMVDQHYVDRPHVEPLYALNYGAAGLSLGPNTGESWIGPEIMIPAGTVRPGDILVQKIHWQESGVTDTGARRQRIFTSQSVGGTTGGQLLPEFAITNSTSCSVDVFKSIFIATSTFLASHWGYIPGIHGGNINVTLNGSGFAANLYMRPSMANLSTTGTVTIYHASLWLYRGGL